MDLNKRLISNTASTFFAHVDGTDGDILIIDKSIEPINNSTVIVFIDNTFRIKRLQTDNNGTKFLIAENCKPIIMNDETPIWGVVRYYIKKL